MLDRTQQPTVTPIDKINIALPEKRIMPNGIPLSVINAGEQEVVRLDLIFGGGKWHQTQVLQALFANRMLREGSRTFTSKQIAEKLDYYGAWLELSSAFECTYLTLYSLNKYFEQTLAVIESILKEPTFPDKELSTVVDANKQQFLVNSTKVDVIAQKNYLCSVFGSGHPCSHYAEIGDFDKITPVVLKEFHDRYYHSQNCSAYLAGKVTDKIMVALEKALGTAEWGNVSMGKAIKNSYPIEPTKEKRIYIERSDAMQSSIKMGAPMMKRTNPEYLKMRVLMTIFGGYFGSRLMSNIREDKGYTYGIAAGIGFYSDSGIFTVSTEAANEYAESIVKEVYHEIDLLQTELVSPKELEMVRSYMLGDMCRSYEGPFSLSDAWMFIDVNHLDTDYFQRSLEAVRTVTPSELRDLACKYIHKDTLIEVIAGKKV